MTPPRVITSKTVQFGVFELDLQRAELRKQGVKVKLQEQPLKVLQLLLENPGQIVGREQIRIRIWPANTFVEFDQGLYSAMARLRDTLGDSSDSPRFIETVARRGYRFIAPVSERVDEERGYAKDTVPRPGNYVRRLAVSVLAGLLGGALLLGLFLGFNLGSARERLRHYGRRPIRSIAVLPLQNLSNDPQQDYFADGMTDELTTELAQVSGLRVISRTSAMQYKATKKSLPQIARELNVDAVVEGSVVRSGDRVRITAQLVDATTDQHLWAQSYERDLRDILSLQSDIAHGVASEVRAALRPSEAARSVNPDAYEAYLRGLAYTKQPGEESWRTSVEYFSRAIRIDSKWAAAYAQLAHSYDYIASAGHIEFYPKSEAAALQAIRLDDRLSEAHQVLAFTLHNYDWDWEGAEREYKRALELNPNLSEAHHGYALLLMAAGRGKEAVTEIRRAEELDPRLRFCE